MEPLFGSYAVGCHDGNSASDGSSSLFDQTNFLVEWVRFVVDVDQYLVVVVAVAVVGGECPLSMSDKMYREKYEELILTVSMYLLVEKYLPVAEFVVAKKLYKASYFAVLVVDVEKA